MERKSFVFYASWLEAIENLPTDMQGDALLAIAKYGLRGEEVAGIRPVAKAMLTMVKMQIDANNARYEAGCKGAIYGKLGGRPRKTNPSKTPRKPLENPSKTPRKPLENPSKTPNEPLMIDDRCKMKKKKEREKENSRSRFSFFESFWESFPETARKTPQQKNACEEFWGENNLDDLSFEVMDALAYWKRSSQWSDPNYIPSPMNWLRKEPWTADIESAEKSIRASKTKVITDKEACELEYEYERLLNTEHALGLGEEQKSRLNEVKSLLKAYKEQKKQSQEKQ